MHSDYELLLKQRCRLDEVRIEQHAIFDKFIVALSTSAIGASLFLVSEISKSGEASDGLYLVVSWVFYVASVAATMLSLLTAARDAASEILAIDKEITDGKSSETVVNRYRTMTKMLNGISISSFFIATCALLAFSYSNSF